MDADFWHSRWQEQRIGFHQKEINSYLKEIWPDLKRPKGSLVFVPLSGKSVDMLWLADEGHKIIGVELSSIAVADFFTENDIDVTIDKSINDLELWYSTDISLYAGDFFNLTAEQLSSIDAIYDRASLIALPKEMRPDYADHLTKITPKNTPVLLITMEYHDSEMNGPPFSVNEKELYALFEKGFSISKIKEIDALQSSPNLKKRGLTKMVEKCWLLKKR